MKSFIFAAALGFALTFSVTSPAAEQPMPVFFQTQQNGPTYPVLAKKGDAYFPVFVVKGQEPYFQDAEGVSHFVSSKSENYKVVYMNGQTNAPVEMPQGKSDDAKNVLVSTKGEQAENTLVHWHGRGWYGGGYVSYTRYSYYPSYYYGGWTGASYYGGGYYGGYYGGYANYGYCGGYYNSGYYGWRSVAYVNPYYYSGYGCVLNNWCW